MTARRHVDRQFVALVHRSGTALVHRHFSTLNGPDGPRRTFLHLPLASTMANYLCVANNSCSVWTAGVPSLSPWSGLVPLGFFILL